MPESSRQSSRQLYLRLLSYVRHYARMFALALVAIVVMRGVLSFFTHWAKARVIDKLVRDSASVACMRRLTERKGLANG